MNRVWMAATVAVVNSHSEQGQKIKSGIMSLNHGRKYFFSGGSEAADLRPIAGVVNSDVGRFAGGGGEDKRRQSEESLRQVMYMNCWGPS